MLKIAGKVLGFFVLLICTLSIHINDKSLFSYFYKAARPVVAIVQNTTEDLFGKAYNATSSYSRKIFSNQVPKKIDSVRSKMSATRSSTPLEEIKNEEKQELDDLIKNHH